MFVVERSYANGTSTLHGPMFRRKTAEKVIERIKKANPGMVIHAVVRPLEAWRLQYRR